MELKLKQFAEIETLLMKECEQVEKTRQRFAAERARMLSTRFGSNNNNNTPRQQQQQLTTSSSLLPSFHQQIHPQMQFMARQQQPAFSFGPRFPLNSLQNSSASPNQPSFTHPMVRTSTGSSSGLNS
ncbi:PREDICTED: SWI/SNF complex subunit SWI3C-like [Tarenaya hassleriana]|uniref:SWI/SNF complex subunit SWI3C-like n=1 Tax=Tarenaya hassleriana TaxID=28532 RepID=UPI00053C1BA2|nr:PREDICTED: SWI/SNF complex subunit SWI3C-like [Tarenaya hassleriana]